ncbi:MAG: hypothetical protein EOP07_04240 [Proteobacteria bacterium]|nr:MAG: hypothetical protein EOP07_04240 [Pseudomonadota bacterium]
MKTKTNILLFAAFSIALACSRDRPHPVSGGGGAGTSAADDAIVQISIPEESPLNIRPEAGSNLRFADGHALTKIYTRIFPKRSYGFEQCRNNNYAYRSDCQDTMFAPDERGFMGMIDLHSPRFGRGPQNIRRPEDMTLNYTRSLRVALGRECENLVKNEMKNLSEGKADLNLLIKTEKPTKEALEEFFRKVLGIEGTGMSVQFLADEYLAGYAQYVGTKTDAGTRQNAYFGLCIAIAMDPQVFLY